MNNSNPPPNSNNGGQSPAIDFLDVTAHTQLTASSLQVNLPNQPVVPNEFLKNCENLWRTKGQLNYYQKGLFLGKGDQSNILFQEFLKKFRKTLEEIIREELKLNNQTSETFKDDFRTLESLFNMIQHHLKTMNVEIKDEKFLAVLHGFITSYVNSVTNPN